MASARGTTRPVKRTAEAKQAFVALTTATARPGAWAAPGLDMKAVAAMRMIHAAARLLKNDLPLFDAIAGELVSDFGFDRFCRLNVAIAAGHIAIAPFGDASPIQGGCVLRI